jgi:hypothetical protein
MSFTVIGLWLCCITPLISAIHIGEGNRSWIFAYKKCTRLKKKKILCLFHCRNIQKTIAVIRNESLMTIMSGQLICLFYFLLLQTLSQKMNSLLRKVQSNLPMWSPSIKQLPVLKGHIFLVLSQKISYELNLF